MTARGRKRQILLLLGAILLPAIMLVALAARVLRQDAELTQKRTAEDRVARLGQLRHELVTHLEAIKLQEVNRLMQKPNTKLPIRPADSPIVFIAPVDRERFLLPWPAVTKRRTRESSRIANILQRGEDLEFLVKDFEGAAGVYRDAVFSSYSADDKCESQLRLGRILVKLKRRDEARTIYVTMLDECGTVTDEDGIRLDLYAAERLITGELDENAAAQFLTTKVEFESRSPLEMSLLNSLLPSLKLEEQQTLDRLRHEIQARQEITALFNDFPKVLARIEPPAEQNSQDPVWVAYGNKPWLITLTANTSTVPPLVFAIQAASVAPTGAHLSAVPTSGSEPVGEAFPGLRVEWVESMPPRASIPTPAYLIGIGIILTLTLLIAFLLLRDVNRGIEVAELREHFVASVSHELKSPLTVIRMYAEMLMNGHIEDHHTSRDYHQTIIHESERLTRLVDNVLEFSKLEHVQESYRPRPASLPQIVRSAAMAMDYQFSKEGFVLDILAEDSGPQLPVDRAALEQAIINLLTNAKKYSGDSRRIELVLRTDEKEATIQVRDWGLGIAPQHHARIFEKFYRVRSPETEAITGTGLGLTLVARVVQAHGGKIEVNSTPGQGSTFTIHLPLQPLPQSPKVPV